MNENMQRQTMEMEDFREAMNNPDAWFDTPGREYTDGIPRWVMTAAFYNTVQDILWERDRLNKKLVKLEKAMG